jgi:methyltransferase-like protein
VSYEQHSKKRKIIQGVVQRIKILASTTEGQEELATKVYHEFLSDQRENANSTEILRTLQNNIQNILKTVSNPVKRVLVDSLTENLPLSMAERISGVPHPTIVEARKDKCHNQLDKLSVNVY